MNEDEFVSKFASFSFNDAPLFVSGTQSAVVLYQWLENPPCYSLLVANIALKTEESVKA